MSAYGYRLKVCCLLLTIQLTRATVELLGPGHHHWYPQRVGSPFGPGTFATSQRVIEPSVDNSPLKSTVYYPVTPGAYAPIVFIGGMYGYVLSEYYSTFLTTVASHGYIVIGMDPRTLTPQDEHISHTRNVSKHSPNNGVGDNHSVTSKLEFYLKQMSWLKDHLRNITATVPDWGKAALMCQSAGCDDTLLMINGSRSIAHAAIFIDPVSFHSLDLQPIPSRIPALSFMSQLSEDFPYCCISGMGWKKVYSLMTCTKVRMEIKDFGHCDLLEQSVWEKCHATKICRTTDDSRLQEYRQFASGVVDAFLRWTLYGDKNMAQYVTVPSLMPLPIEGFAFSVTC
ncbi:unnamed protein product [Lymnaea stagnalis]|uniref:Chlorophyllase n=1 Tax=Lymnaea stagnalis TaxID=6523 RepID=A0AAV2IEC6_LYMST